MMTTKFHPFSRQHESFSLNELTAEQRFPFEAFHAKESKPFQTTSLPMSSATLQPAQHGPAHDTMFNFRGPEVLGGTTTRSMAVDAAGVRVECRARAERERAPIACSLRWCCIVAWLSLSLRRAGHLRRRRRGSRT